MPRDRHIIGNAVHDHNIGITRRQRIFQQDQTIGRAESADPGVALCSPIARERHIAWIAQLRDIIGVDSAVRHHI